MTSLNSRGTKACANCGADFPTSQARRKFCSDECQRERERKNGVERRAAQPEHYRAKGRAAYARNREVRREAVRLYGRSDRGRELQRKRAAVRRATECEKIAARTMLNNALRRGNISRGACRDCGSPNTHGHHHDYSKPLDVIWLCPEHHVAEHRRIDNE